MTETCHLSEADQHNLLELARNSIKHGLADRTTLPVNPDLFPEPLREPRAVFVTLEIESELRGCIGTLQDDAPLVQNVARYAHAAAFSDSRFPPLSAEELPLIKIHISILSSLQRIQFSSQAELLAQIQPGIDGLLLEEGGHRGTLLPSVWEAIPDKNEFWQRLKLKAGLPAHYWSNQIQVQRYTTFCFPKNS